MAVTIRELAKACRVSTATVSRVFNQHPSVKPETRERVLRLARKHGYAPRVTARRSCLAVVVEGFEAIELAGYSGMLIAALSREIYTRGVQMEIVRAADIPLLRAKCVSGVVACVYGERALARLGELDGIPTVTINTRVPRTPAVISNDRQGMKLAVEHLVAAGHKRIAALRRGGDNLNKQARDRGYVEAMTAAGLEADLLFPAVQSAGIVEAVAKILRQGATAIVGTGEELGPAMAYAAQLLDRRVPGDVSLLGFERQGVSCYTFPPQTTIKQDFAGLAASALNVLERAQAGKKPARVISIDYQLIERESVGPANG